MIPVNKAPSRELLSVQFLPLDSRIQDNMNLIDSLNSTLHMFMQMQFLFVINIQIKMHRIKCGHYQDAKVPKLVSYLKSRLY